MLRERPPPGRKTLAAGSSRPRESDAGPQRTTSKFFGSRASTLCPAGPGSPEPGRELKLLEKTNRTLRTQQQEQTDANAALKKDIERLLREAGGRELEIEELAQKTAAVEVCRAETERQNGEVRRNVRNARQSIDQLVAALARERCDPDPATSMAALAELEIRRVDARARLESWRQKLQAKAEKEKALDASVAEHQLQLRQLREEKTQLSGLLLKFVQLKTSFTEKINSRAQAPAEEESDFSTV